MTGERRPWRGDARFALVALLLPLLALPLLWRRPERRSAKVLGSVLLLVMTGVYADAGLRLARGWPGRPVSGPAPGLERHWRALEADRAQDAARPPATRSAAGAPYWTGFRGPGSAGRLPAGAALEAWPEGGPELLWRKPVGEGWSSFAIADGLAFTLERRRGLEVAAAYELETGREVWTASWRSTFAESADRDGPRATPSWDQGRVYALGAAGVLVALDAGSGRELWRRSILDESDARNLTWGVAASPVIAGELVVALPGGPDGHAVVTYDKVSGEPRWTALSDAAAYATPVVATLAGRPQLLVVTATRAVGLDLASGALLWEHPWATDMGINAAQPVVVGADRFVLSSGYGQGAELVEVRRDGDAFAASSLWHSNRMKNKLSSSVAKDGYLYGLDEGILACLELDTGVLRWKGGRYGHGQLLLAGESLVVLAENGELAMVEASPHGFVERARFAALEGRSWNHPAWADDVLLVRNARQMAAFRLAARGGAAP